MIPEFKKLKRQTLYLLLGLTLTFCQFNAFGQQEINDSLFSLLKNEKEDIKKVNILIAISEQYIISGDYNHSIKYAVEAFSICEKNILITSGNNKRAYLKEKANAYNMIAIVYRYWGDYPKALENHFYALKIREEIGDKKGIARSYLGIGSIYYFQGKYNESLKNYIMSYKIYVELDYKWGLANSLVHIGDIYREQGNYTEAMKNYFLSQKLWSEINNKKGVAESYNAIGWVYSKQGNYTEAMKNYFSALKINEDVEYKDEIIKSYTNIGLANIQLQKYEEAKKYLDLAINVSKEVGSKEDLKKIYKTLSEMEYLENNFEGAFENYKYYIHYKDSLVNQSSSEKITLMQMQYAQDKKDILTAQEKRRHKIITYFVSVGLILALLLSVLIFRSYRQKQKANLIIAEKNKQITDSITYALRIQQAKLPKKEEIYSIFPNSFVLFKPKDIVSGDFYYFHKNDKLVFIASADCTGHGVPGAFMSMIGSDRLEDAISLSTDTSVILNLLNKGIKKSLHQSEGSESTRDGMDIAICCIDTQNCTLRYAGARRPLWIIRSGHTKLEEIKATKVSIGGLTGDDQHFETHEINIQKGDTFYICTDGYSDQFDGLKGKKLMTRKFKEILLSIQSKTMQEQEMFLDNFIENWKAWTEQVDDILVIGVRF